MFCTNMFLHLYIKKYISTKMFTQICLNKNYLDKLLLDKIFLQICLTKMFTQICLDKYV